ncbi:hypothetical protein OJF2_62040 [Aquisphaera giovannonii]|uniref:Uncharacterized protein n=1 Tax=Aquisphaera giovannonii TaxID=406548 RepID=A0A5B9WAS2_9BACT|nr:serine hydrolase [Aquisphaera giovannonii]QEH37613.1 hypothetical protein OJF2_62040 [Aquisphaera giovannonii]
MAVAAEDIQELIDGLVAGDVGVVVGIIDEDHPYDASTPYLIARGNVVSSKNHQQALDLNGTTPFKIGSVTKIFTATLLTNRFLDLPVPNWGSFADDFTVLGVPQDVAAITLQQMLSYQSGFDADNKGAVWYRG